MTTTVAAQQTHLTTNAGARTLVIRPRVYFTHSNDRCKENAMTHALRSEVALEALASWSQNDGGSSRNDVSPLRVSSVRTFFFLTNSKCLTLASSCCRDKPVLAKAADVSIRHPRTVVGVIVSLVSTFLLMLAVVDLFINLQSFAMSLVYSML